MELDQGGEKEAIFGGNRRYPGRKPVETAKTITTGYQLGTTICCMLGWLFRAAFVVW